MNYRSKPHKPRNDIVPVRTSRVLFDATQRQRPQPYFGRGIVRYVPYHAAPASIADMLWLSSQNGRRAEQEWDDATVAEAREAEEMAADAMRERYAVPALSL